MPLALITNDDGIHSPGLYPLARGARKAGYDVVVAAPAADASGAGGSVRSVVGDDDHTEVVEHEIPELDGIPAFAVAAATRRGSCTRPGRAGSSVRRTSCCPGSTSAPTSATR